MNAGTEHLDGCKEIACYLKGSVRCVQRWERNEGLPLQRHAHARGVRVYVFRQELDAWWQDERRRSKELDIERTSLAAGTQRVVTAEAIVSSEGILNAEGREVASGNRGQTELALTARVVAVVHLVLVLLRGGTIQT